MRFSDEEKSRLLLALFAIAFVASVIVIWYSMVISKNYIIYTDEESVPEPTDFFAEVPEMVIQLWTN